MTYYAYAPRNCWTPDPVPAVPTPEEIEIADELRHRLELTLLTPAECPKRRFGATEFGWADSYEE